MRHLPSDGHAYVVELDLTMSSNWYGNLTAAQAVNVLLYGLHGNEDLEDFSDQWLRENADKHVVMESLIFTYHVINMIF